MMNKGKHLTLDERKQIETLLNRKHSYKSIGRELSRDCTTIAKEVSAHVIFKRTAIRGVTCNNCKHRFQCTQHHLCRDCATPRQSKKCHFCKLCNFVAKSMKLTSALHWKRLRITKCLYKGEKTGPPASTAALYHARVRGSNLPA